MNWFLASLCAVVIVVALLVGLNHILEKRRLAQKGTDRSTGLPLRPLPLRRSREEHEAQAAEALRLQEAGRPLQRFHGTGNVRPQNYADYVGNLRLGHQPPQYQPGIPHFI